MKKIYITSEKSGGVVVTLNAAAAAIVWLNTEEEGRKDIARALKLGRMRPIYIYSTQTHGWIHHHFLWGPPHYN